MPKPSSPRVHDPSPLGAMSQHDAAPPIDPTDLTPGPSPARSHSGGDALASLAAGIVADAGRDSHTYVLRSDTAQGGE